VVVLAQSPAQAGGDYLINGEERLRRVCHLVGFDSLRRIKRSAWRRSVWVRPKTTRTDPQRMVVSAVSVKDVEEYLGHLVVAADIGVSAVLPPDPVVVGQLVEHVGDLGSGGCCHQLD